jgi:hypothetical protein
MRFQIIGVSDSEAINVERPHSIMPAPPHRGQFGPVSKPKQRKANPAKGEERTGDRRNRRQGDNGLRWVHD